MHSFFERILSQFTINSFRQWYPIHFIAAFCPPVRSLLFVDLLLLYGLPIHNIFVNLTTCTFCFQHPLLSLTVDAFIVLLQGTPTFGVVSSGSMGTNRSDNGMTMGQYNNRCHSDNGLTIVAIPSSPKHLCMTKPSK